MRAQLAARHKVGHAGTAPDIVQRPGQHRQQHHPHPLDCAARRHVAQAGHQQHRQQHADENQRHHQIRIGGRPHHVLAGPVQAIQQQALRQAGGQPQQHDAARDHGAQDDGIAAIAGSIGFVRRLHGVPCA